MMPHARRISILAWVPMGFCTGLSIITIVAMIWMMAANSTSEGGWAIVFLCNLPLCFMFVGFMTSHLQREIRELREQIAVLQKTNAG
jgi:MFS family permease